EEADGRQVERRRDPGHDIAQEDADEHVDDDDNHEQRDHDVRDGADPRQSRAHGARMVKLPRSRSQGARNGGKTHARKTLRCGSAGTMRLVGARALWGGHSPASGQAKPGVKKLDFPHITAPPESSAVAFKWMSEELTKRSAGSLNVVFHGATLITKELEVMDA